MKGDGPAGPFGARTETQPRTWAINLTPDEIDALLEAAGFRLAGEIEERSREQIEALDSAQAKLARHAR